MARVQVSPDRVIRTTVGLRPFRPSGFVVRAEKLGEKTVIHNYGHGGAGITLSWGTAQLAVEQAAGIDARDCAVIGCGVIGLSTARLLQLRGYRPPFTPRPCRHPRPRTWRAGCGSPSRSTMTTASRLNSGLNTLLRRALPSAIFSGYPAPITPYAGCRSIPFRRKARIRCRQPATPQAKWNRSTPQRAKLTPAENPFATPFAYRRHSMLIEPAPYLTALIRDFHLAGGHIVIRTFDSTRDLAGLPETLLFNCTGLGAKTLFGDEELTPIRGQLVVMLPQPEIDYMTLGPNNTYMFPRRDGILLGGSFDRGNSNLDPDPAISERILSGNKTLFDAMKS